MQTARSRKDPGCFGHGLLPQSSGNRGECLDSGIQRWLCSDSLCVTSALSLVLSGPQFTVGPGGGRDGLRSEFNNVPCACC